MLQNDQNQLDYAMLPFVMRDLVNMVMKKKMLPILANFFCLIID